MLTVVKPEPLPVPPDVEKALEEINEQLAEPTATKSRVRVSSKRLKAALAFIKPAISRRSSLPILSNVLIEWTRKEARFTTTDLETGHSTSIPAQSSAAGSLTINFALLADNAKAVRGDEVTLTFDLETHTMWIVADGSEVELKGITSEEFPPAPKYDDATRITYGNDLLASLGAATDFASTNEARPVLTGVLMCINGRDDIVATDGNRLYVHSIKGFARNLDPEFAADVLIPARVVKTLARLAKAYKDPIVVHLAKALNHIHFELRDLGVISSRLIDGTFVQYQHVVPNATDATMTVDRDAFVAAVKRVTLMAKDSANVVRLVSEGKKIVLSAATNEVGSSRIKVPFAGDQFAQFAINGHYLAEAAAAFGERLTIGFNGALSPITISDRGRGKAVIMPCRVAV